jgi:hypothetical protein
MTTARPALALIVLALALAACSSRSHDGPGGPRGRGGPSPVQAETTAAVACRIAPYAGADGAVDRAALDKGLHAAFTAADANGDGVLQKTEIAALNARRGSGCDNDPVIDWDGAGRMTYAAFAARALTLFDRADADGDGIATAEEMASAGRPPRGRAGPPPGSAQGPGGQPQ